jgi:UDP-glucose 4-epimerase
MQVLVTGGAGFIGSHTVERVLELGATVRVLDNLSSGKRCNLREHPKLELIVGDIRQPAAVEQAMDGVSHVIQLAAQVSVAASVDNPASSAATTVSGFLNVLDSARRHAVQRFVYASSSAVYGAVAGKPTSESALPKPISPYGLDKLVDDLYAGMFRDLFSTSCLGLRYFNVFGPRQDASSPYSGVISIFMRALRGGNPLRIYGDGRQTRDFIYVDDVARINALALDARLEGVCNVATGRSISLLELVDALTALTGCAAPIEWMTERCGDIRHSGGDNGRLRTELDYHSFTTVETGLLGLWEHTEKFN